MPDGQEFTNIRPLTPPKNSGQFTNIRPLNAAKPEASDPLVTGQGMEHPPTPTPTLPPPDGTQQFLENIKPTSPTGSVPAMAPKTWQEAGSQFKAVAPIAGSVIAGELTGGASLIPRIAAQFAGAGLGELAGQKASGEKVDFKEAAKTGGEFATAEGIGGALVSLGDKLAPSALRKVAYQMFAPRMEEAGQAINKFLSQPKYAGVTVDVGTPVNDFLDKEIARAQKAGGGSLAKRLTKLKTEWNTNYNLGQRMSLTDANAFKRDISAYTTYAGDANKIGLNQIQKQVGGITAGQIESAAPGVKPLNDAYANLANTKKAVSGSAKKLTTGYTGTGTAALSYGLRGAGPTVTGALKTGAAIDQLPSPAPIIGAQP
jgi:hypothetical protein